MSNQTAILLGIAAVGLVILAKVVEAQNRWADVVSGSGPGTTSMFGMSPTERAYWYNRAWRLGPGYHH